MQTTTVLGLLRGTSPPNLKTRLRSSFIGRNTKTKPCSDPTSRKVLLVTYTVPMAAPWLPLQRASYIPAPGPWRWLLLLPKCSASLPNLLHVVAQSPLLSEAPVPLITCPSDRHSSTPQMA